MVFFGYFIKLGTFWYVKEPSNALYVEVVPGQPTAEWNYLRTLWTGTSLLVEFLQCVCKITAHETEKHCYKLQLLLVL